MSIAIVTATADLERSHACVASWSRLAKGPVDIYVVINGRGVISGGWQAEPAALSGTVHSIELEQYLGVVPAYAIGVAKALEDGHQIIACFHDDLEIEDREWDVVVEAAFAKWPSMGLCGFAGAKGLGHDQIYQIPYDPMQLARQDFRSNMRHAEAHGSRVGTFEWVACLDGFSQIGRREFWLGLHQVARTLAFRAENVNNLFALMQDWGIVHHCYDGALGAFAFRLGWKVGLLPLAVHHHGGQTAVSDMRYHEWAIKTASPTADQKGDIAMGDAAFWLAAHRTIYNEFRDQLPIRVP